MVMMSGKINCLEIGQSFVEKCERITRINELKLAFRQATEEMGFRFFACVSHVDPLNPPDSAIIIHTFPRRWIKHFSERRLDRIDPVFQYASRTAQPFFWGDAGFLAGLSERQKAIMAEAEEAGLSRGFTVPIHSPGALPASCTVIPYTDVGAENDPLSYLAVYLMAVYLYETASRIVAPRLVALRSLPKLTAQEQRCLRYVAQGKSDWAIAQIMGLSQSTVHHHVERAKKRLGTATRVQAVVQALYGNQLSFQDVIGILDTER